MIATRATVATLFKRQRNCFKLSSHSVKPAYPSESVLASCSLALVRAQIRARAFSPSPVRRDDEDDQQQRAQWSELLKQRQSIRNHNYRASQPKEIFEVTFSRSGGPGGQNVNKVSTKANVRLLLGPATSTSPGVDAKSPVPLPIPRAVIKLLASDSPYYVASSHSLLVTSSKHRSQDANLTDAVEKLCGHLQEVATEGLKGETSAEQRERVKQLQQKEKRKVRESKTKRSDVKAGRRKTSFAD